MKRTLAPFALTLIALFLATSAAAAPPDGRDSNWPQWRGSDSSGVSADTTLPAEWSTTQNILWKVPIPGRGHSSPIVWGNRVFLTTSIEGDVVPGAKAPIHKFGEEVFLHPDSVGADRSYKLQLLCLDRDTGKILWERTAHEGPVFDNRHRKNTYATPTPVTDGQTVFAYFGTPGLYAFDFSGKQLWKADIGEIPTLGMGVGTSPVLYNDLIILQVDREVGDGSYIAAFNKPTGKEAWRTPRKIQVSWSTPIVVQSGDRSELVTNGNESIIAYDPATGKELWRTDGVDSNAIPTPVAGHGLVFVSSGYPKKIVKAIKLGSAGPEDAPQIVWTYDRGTAYVPSAILYGDFLYLTSDRGILTCLDAKTGAVKYSDGRVPVPATFTASPIAFEGMIFQFSEDGDTFVAKAGPKHEFVRTNSIGEPIYSTPAAAGGILFIRGEKNLYAIRTATSRQAAD